MPKVEIKLDLSKFESIHRAAQDAALETVGGLRSEVQNAQVVPRDQGFLENSMRAPEQIIQGDEIHTVMTQGGGDVPYARRLYHHPEYNFQTVNNPNAQGEWLKPWLPGGDLESYVPDTFTEKMEESLK